MVYCLGFWVMADSLLKERLQSFIECEARSCSMDFGCITPEYVYRMWGGSVAIDEIATGLTELRKNGCKEERGDRYMFRNNRSWLKYW